jgi:dynein heavy chain
VNWMYNTSLQQFLTKFDEAIDKADKNVISEAKKVENIEEKLTYVVFRYINKGLFVKDKMTFVLMICLKTLIVAGKLTAADVGILLRSGLALDVKTEKPNPFSKWLSDAIWLNILALSRHHYGREGLGFFRDLPESITRNDAAWKTWYTSTEPENEYIPEFDERIRSEKEIGRFIHLTLVRSIREDRTVIFAMDFIRKMLSKDYTDPVNDNIEDIWAESNNREPVLFLLSAGADPTQNIEDFARRKKKSSCDRISMGDGMDAAALEACKSGFLSGNWVILQNCHLGLDFMGQMETLLGQGNEIEEDFRLWLTCEQRDSFPIGLLQMA